MRIVALYVVWDGVELLKHSIRIMRPVVDDIMIVFSNTSNYGEFKDTFEEIRQAGVGTVTLYNFEPIKGLNPSDNERMKRNFILNEAKKAGFTHFIMLDCDEFYERDKFLNEWARFHINPDLKGMVASTEVYFKSPTLSAGKDRTLVPFIHKITSDLAFVWNKQYPFAWIDREIRIDPTRQMNITEGVIWTAGIHMHHMSWVRKDIKMKIRNSTARANIMKSDVVQEYILADVDYFCKFYGNSLVRALVDFNIPENEVTDLQPL